MAFITSGDGHSQQIYSVNDVQFTQFDGANFDDESTLVPGCACSP